MKIFQDGGDLNYGVVYKVELSSALEVAELGEHAYMMELNLPEGFDMRNKKMMDELFEKLKPIMIEKGYDTVLLKREQYEEFVYFLQDKEIN